MTETAFGAVRHVCHSGQISETIVTAVANAKGVDPLDLEPLYPVVDPDALNSMFRQSAGRLLSSLELCFSMADYQVVVHGDGEVVVAPPERPMKARHLSFRTRTEMATPQASQEKHLSISSVHESQQILYACWRKNGRHSRGREYAYG